MNYYARHVGDYIRDTAHLTLLEHGVYTRLLDVYYTREAAIPADQACRLIGARTKEEREAAESVLGEFFVQQDGHWHHKRCDEELAKHAEFTASQKRKGQASGQARRLKSGSTEGEPAANSGSTEHEQRFNSGSTGSEPPISHYPLPSPVLVEPDGRAPAKPNLDDFLTDATSRIAMAEWIEHRAKRGKPLRDHELIAVGKTLSGMGDATRQLAAVRFCVANGFLNLRHTDAGTKPEQQTVQRWTPPAEDEGAARASRRL